MVLSSPWKLWAQPPSFTGTEAEEPWSVIYSEEKGWVGGPQVLLRPGTGGRLLWQPLPRFRRVISKGLLISAAWVGHPGSSEGRGASLCRRQLSRQMFDPAQNHFPNFLRARAGPSAHRTDGNERALCGQLGGEAPSPQVHPEAAVWSEEPGESRAVGSCTFTMPSLCRAPGVAALLPDGSWSPHPSEINFWEENKRLRPILHREIPGGWAATSTFYIPRPVFSF